MTEVLVEFDTIVRGEDGSRWIPRACGRIADDEMWEGWIEFTSTERSVKPVRTGRETEQRDRSALVYWAEGLTQVYLEGALHRALTPSPAPPHPIEVSVQPAYSGPRPSGTGDAGGRPDDESQREPR